MFKRKSLTALLTVAVIIMAAVMPFLCAKPFAASAQESVSTGFQYEDETTKKVITGFELPATVTGDFEVVIPDGVTEIKADVFYNNSKLRGVTLCQGLQIIGDNAFAKTSVARVNFPKSVTRIGEHAFDSCVELTGITFEEGRESALTISSFAFSGCRNLSLALRLPDNTRVGQYAFELCTSLLWVYVGNDCRFISSTGAADANAVFFPTETSIKIIFPSQDAYETMLTWAETTFKTKHSNASTYIVKVNCYTGESKTPAVYERLHGYAFNYIPDAATGEWNTDTAFDKLPVQASNYSSTTWYGESTFKTSVDYAGVNELLKTKSEIKLYCHETITAPAFPAEPVSWVYDEKISYDIDNLADVLKALGCEQEYTDAQLAALSFEVVYADSESKIADKPDKISRNGVYSVTVTLNPEYGEWVTPAASSITINVNTTPFNIVLIVLCVVGALAIVVTVSTAVIRKKVLAKNKRKQISSKEALEKYNKIVGNNTAE